MTNVFDRDHFQFLLNGLVNETLSAEEHATLQQQLKSNEVARSYYSDFIDVHVGLRKLTRRDDSAIIEPTVLFSHSWSSCSSIDRATRSRKFSKTLIAYASLATVACLLVSLSILNWSVSTKSSNNTKTIVNSPDKNLKKTGTDADRDVTLVQTAGAKFFGEWTPTINSPLEWHRDYALTTGMIELRFPSGASTIIESPAVFSITSATRLRLQTGQCSVHAPDGAQGFQVETPLTEVVDLGTRFSIAVDEAGGTDVQVVEGAAEVSARSAQPTVHNVPVRLLDRQARKYLESGSIVSESIAFSDSQYRRQLPDRVASYEATNPNARGVVDLVSVTVQREGRSIRYPIDRLIPIELTHYKSASDLDESSPIAYQLDQKHTRVEQVFSDIALNTGVINPGGSATPLHSDPIMNNPEKAGQPNTPGMSIRFASPIVNQTGPDIVLFDLQTMTNPSNGDAFHIGPVTFRPHLKTHSVTEFDITMNSRESMPIERFGLARCVRPISSLDDLLTIESTPSRVHLNFRALAVGIDLSSMGYAEGDTIDELFIQDAMDDNKSFIDPVYIGGLPALEQSR